MIRELVILFAVFTAGWTRPGVVYLQGPSTRTEILGSDGTLINAYSPGSHISSSVDNGYVSYNYGQPSYGFDSHEYVTSDAVVQENPLLSSNYVVSSGQSQLYPVYQNEPVYIPEYYGKGVTQYVQNVEPFVRHVQNVEPVVRHVQNVESVVRHVQNVEPVVRHVQPVVTHVEQPRVITQRVSQPVVISQPSVAVVNQAVGQKKTIVSSSLDQTHPSPIVVPATPSVQLSIRSEPVHAPLAHIETVTAAPVIVRSSTPIPIIAHQPVVTKTVLTQPAPVVTKTVVSQPVPVVTKTVVEAPSAVVHTSVAKIEDVTAEVSDLTPLTSGKKFKSPAHHEAAINGGEVIKAKTLNISPHFIAEGPDATYLAPGTGIRGQYVHNKDDKNDDGSYKGEFYHGLGKVIKVDKNEI